MPEKQVIKALEKSGFLYFQDSAEGNIPFQGNKAKDLFERFYELVESRGIPKTTIKRTAVNNLEYLIITHKITDNVIVHMAVAIEEYGKDLRINLFFAQYDAKKVSNQIILGMVIAFAGLCFWWTGVGVAAMIAGIIMAVKAKGRFSDQYITERDGFFSTVLGILENACDEAGIDFDATNATPSH
jgi:hypothetical protein